MSADVLAAPFDKRALGAAGRLAAKADRPVLMHAPAYALQAPGGGENQLVQTAGALAELGVPVRALDPWTDRIADARVLHLFGMSAEGLELARVAKRVGTPVVLTPIFWASPLQLNECSFDSIADVKALCHWSLQTVWPSRPCRRRALLSLADAVLPNTRAEALQLVQFFGLDRRKTAIVPNGIDERFADADPGIFREIHGGDDFVLYAGRVEPRKNLERLIVAVRTLGLKLVVIGDPPPGREAYGERLRRLSAGFSTWIPRLDADDPLLSSACSAARVSALVSLFETPGLFALEAGLAGSAVAITSRGGTQEYFGPFADYANPSSLNSIRKAIASAWTRGGSAPLKERIRSRYLSRHVAVRTRRIYDAL